MRKISILLGLALFLFVSCSTDDSPITETPTGDTEAIDGTSVNVDENAADYEVVPVNVLYQILLDGHNWEQYQDYYSGTDILGNANYGTLKTMLAFSDVDTDPANSGSMYSRYKLPSNGNAYDLVYDDIHVDTDVLYLKYEFYPTTSNNHYKEIYYNSSDNTIFIKYYQENETNTYSHLYYKVY